MKELNKWLKHHNLSPAELADCLNVNRSLVHRWCNEGAIPQPDKLRALYRFTRGAVRPDHFYDLPRLGRRVKESELEAAPPRSAHAAE